MNEENQTEAELKMCEKTCDWVETEAIKYIRQFQTARNLKDRETARKRLLEIRTRGHITEQILDKLLNY